MQAFFYSSMSSHQVTSYSFHVTKSLIYCILTKKVKERFVQQGLGRARCTLPYHYSGKQRGCFRERPPAYCIWIRTHDYLWERDCTVILMLLPDRSCHLSTIADENSTHFNLTWGKTIKNSSHCYNMDCFFFFSFHFSYFIASLKKIISFHLRNFIL